MGDHIIPKVIQFKYLEFIGQNNEEIEGIDHQIQTEWVRWCKASDFMRRLVMLFGTECWAVKNQHEN